MTSKKLDSTAKLSFEECYERLEQVISALEAGDLDLDRSIALYEEGMRLAATCERRLDDAQLRVTQLLAKAEGTPGAESAGAITDSADEPPKGAGSSGSQQTSYLTFCS
ncbi:MAG: exodeoxyribonuclease VII small subunit [Chloroflexi bacterium]|nr:exodeoxyribonuclease VII small subunit [Chloroflexota bacterium]